MSTTPTADDQFADTVLACVEDVNALLPRLSGHYPDLVMVTALAEHVGAALRLCIGNGTCTPEQALHLLEHLDVTAFAGSSR
jgi:hypothetical protein